MMDLPLVSVVMAVKNAERYLAEALDSVVRQSFSDYEIVVVDGRSTDDSRRIASSYPGVRVIEQEGPGFAQAWNVGIDASRGAFIAILDSDDTWPAHKLARQVGRFRGAALIWPVLLVGFVAVFAWSTLRTSLVRQVRWNGRTIHLAARP